jgi:hypothetical protein
VKTAAFKPIDDLTLDTIVWPWTVPGGRAAFLTAVHGYLNILKRSSLLMVPLVLILTSFGAARIVRYGLFCKALPDKGLLKSRVFLFSFAFFFSVPVRNRHFDSDK